MKTKRKSTKPTNDQVFVKNIEGGYLCWCERCGGEHKLLNFPMPADDFTKALFAFNDLHRYCPPTVAASTAGVTR